MFYRGSCGHGERPDGCTGSAALELYDFVVFGVFASAIGAAFFPTVNPLLSQMLAYAGFAIGYLARPVGGIVLGHFGDRVGRRIVFVGSMLVVFSSSSSA
jgi:MFS family permease